MPVEEVARDLLALRARAPDRLFVLAAAGAPPRACEDEDYECLLDDPAMEPRIEETPDGPRLAASCEVAGAGRAEPPRRIVELIRQIAAAGGNGGIVSICEEPWRVADPISASIQSCLRGGCIARSPPVDEQGHVPCVIVESVPSSESCPAARIDLGVRAGLRRCRLCQVGDAEGEPVGEDWAADLHACAMIERAGAAWRFVAGSQNCPATGEIEFGTGGELRPRTLVDLECLTRICSD